MRTILLKKGFTTAILWLLLLPCTGQKKTAVTLFIGTYTNTGKSEGIYSYLFDINTGDARLLSKALTQNPSYLTISRNRQFLYSVNQEYSDHDGISAFKIDAVSGKIEFLNRVPSNGKGPCHVFTDSRGRYVFAATYYGGSLSAIRIKKDGSLDLNSQTIQHLGKSIVPKRQDSAHVHSVVLSPDEKWLLVQDLGMDQVKIYPVDLSKTSSPIGASTDSCQLQAGSGPRHLVFHPLLKNKAYVVQELEAMVTALSFKNGKLLAEQTVRMSPDNFTGRNGAADVNISPDGKWLYASNRGDANDITIFSLDGKGVMKYQGRQSTLGRGPRNFTIDPTGKFLLVANQQTNEVVIFLRDSKTGMLTDTGKRISVGAPACLKIIDGR